MKKDFDALVEEYRHRSGETLSDATYDTARDICDLCDSAPALFCDSGLWKRVIPLIHHCLAGHPFGAELAEYFSSLGAGYHEEEPCRFYERCGSYQSPRNPMGYLRNLVAEALDHPEASLSNRESESGLPKLSDEERRTLNEKLWLGMRRESKVLTSPAAPSTQLKAPPPRRIKQTGPFPTAAEAFHANAPKLFTSSTAFEYPGGYQVGRFQFEPTGKKSFLPIHEQEGQFYLGDKPGLLPLYKVDQLPKDGPVYVVEGEKKCDAARAIRLPVVTSAHGACAAHLSDWSPLAGRDVIILPDNDEAGKKYAEKVGTALAAMKATVRILLLPGLGDSEDVDDFIKSRAGRTPQSIKAEVEESVSAHAKPFTFAATKLKTVCIANIEEKEQEWVWRGRIVVGGITIIVGVGGQGKGLVVWDSCAHVTTGRDWPDGASCPSGTVLLFNGEDDWATVLHPRLRVAGADSNKVELVHCMEAPDRHGKVIERPFTLAELPALEMALQARPECRLIVIDPLTSFIGGKLDLNRDNEVRSVLAGLHSLAAKYRVGVLLVCHEPKGAATANGAVLGSIGITNLARCVLHLVPDSTNPDRRLLLPGKNNAAALAPGLAFHIVADPIPHIEWEQASVPQTAAEYFAERNRRHGGRPTKQEEAKELIEDFLGDGQWHAKEDVIQHVQKNLQGAISGKTIERVFKSLGGVTDKGFGTRARWKIPPPT